MSSTDNRVVKMTFDNASFESGVSKSMSTIDKLEEKLQFKKAASGLSSLQSSLNSISMTGLANSISKIESRLSTFGIAGATVVSKITNSILNAAKTLESQTLGQIRTGGWARAQNLANAQFMIEGLKFSWDKVRDAADYAVTDTAYGLDAAAKAASQLAASGVDFEKVLETVNGQGLTQMHKSLRAISGVAAMTNSSYEDISRIFTTVAGNGRLMGEQLLQMSSRGLNAAATLAQSLHTTEEEVRDMVSKGKISFQMFSDAMDEAYGEHAKEANKTFTGALSNMKAALSRIGAIFAQPVIDKTNKFFVAVTTQIKAIQKALSDITNKDGSKTLRFASHFAEAWDKGVDAMSKLVSVIDMSWFQKIADKMDTVAQKASKFFDTFMESIDAYKNKIHEIPDAMKNVMISAGAAEISNGVFTILDKANGAAEKQTKILSVTKEEAEAARKVINGLYGNGTERLKKLSAEGFDPKRVQAYVDELLKAGKDTSKMTIQVEGAQGEVAKVIAQARANEHKTLVDRIYSAFSAISKGFETLKNVAKFAKQIIFSVFTAFNNVFKVADGVYPIERFSDLLLELSKKMILSEDGVKKLTTFFEKMFTALKKFGKSSFEYIKKIVDTIKELIDSGVLTELSKKVKEKLAYIKGLFKSAFDDVSKLFKDFSGAKLDILGGKSVSDTIGGFGKSIKDFIDSLPKIDPSNRIESIFEIIKAIVSSISDAIGGFDVKNLAKIAIIGRVVKSIWDILQGFQNVGDTLNSISWLPGKIGAFLESLKDVLKYQMPVLLTNLAVGYLIQSIAKAVIYIVAALYLIAQIDDSALSKSIVVMGVVAFSLWFFMKSISNMMMAIQNQGKMGLGQILTTISSISSIGAVFKALAIALLSIGAAVVLISVASAIMEKSGVSITTFYETLSYVAVVALFAVGFIKLLNNITKESMGGGMSGMYALPVLIISVSVLMGALGATVIELAIATKVLSALDPAAILYGFGMIGIIFLGIKEILKSINDQKPGTILAAGFSLLIMSVAIGVIIFSLTGSLIAIASALSLMDGSSIMSALPAVIGIMSMLLIFIMACYYISKDASETGTKVLGSFVGIAIVLGALALIFWDISDVLSVLGTMDLTTMSAAAAVIFGVMSMLIILVYALSKIDTSTLGDSTAGLSKGMNSFLALATVLILVALAIKLVATSVTDLSTTNTDLSSGLLALVDIMSVLIIVMVVMTKVGSTSTSSILAAGVAMLIVGIAIKIIASALSSISDISGIIEKALAVGIILVAIGGILALLAFVFGKSGNNTGGLIDAALGFVIIAGAIMIFAKAFETLASIESGIGQAVAILLVFVGVMVVLSVISAIFPGISSSMVSIGKAFMYAGIGAALVGAGIYLICAGITKLTPVLPLLSQGMDKIFSVIEKHKVTAIAMLVAVIALTVAITYFASTLKPIVTMITTIITNTVNSVGTMIANAGSGFLNFLSNLTPTTRGILISLIAAVMAALSDSGPQILNTLGKLIFGLVDWLSSIVGPLVDKLLSLVISIIDGLTDAIFSHANQIAASIFNLVYALFDIVLAVMNQILRMVITAGDSDGLVAKFYDSKIAPMFANGQRQLKNLAETNSQAAKAMDNIVSDKLWKDVEKKFGSGEKAVSKTTASLDLFSKKAGDLPFDFQIFGDKSTSSMSSMSNGIAQLGKAMNDLPQAQKDVMVKMGAGVYQDGNFYPIKNAVSNDTDGALDVLNGFGTDTDSFMADQNDLLGQYGYDGGFAYDDEMANGLLDGQSDITDAANNNVDAQIQVVEDRSEDLKQSGRNSVKSTASGMNSEYTTMYHASNILLDGVRAPFETFSSGDKNATGSGRNLGYKGGNALLDGFQEAFDEWPAAIQQAFASTYTNGEEAFTGKNAWDVNSPSKRTMYWGKMIIAGLTNGIYENSPDAVNSIAELSSSMINSFTNPLEYAAKVASGELTYDPSIRPVLDTSNISTGAYGIRSMFDNQNVTLSGFSGRLAADITSLDNTNTQVVNELRSLRKDMNFMTEQIAGMQIVMDSGQLVGAIAPGMDDALGRRAIHRGRGN